MPIPIDRQQFFETDRIRVGTAGSVVDIVELDPNGAGTLSLTVNAPHASLALEGPKICWLTSGRCCDGAIMVECDDGIHLHLIELKKSINASKWIKTKTQWRTMYHNALGIAAIARVRIVNVTCHVAFSNDNFSASLALTKTLVVASGTSPAQNHEWYKGSLDLDDLKSVPLVKHVRDELGNAATLLNC